MVSRASGEFPHRSLSATKPVIHLVGNGARKTFLIDYRVMDEIKHFAFLTKWSQGKIESFFGLFKID